MPKEPEVEKKPQVKPAPTPVVKPEERKLPPHWRTAKDGEGKIYYYHAITRWVSVYYNSVKLLGVANLLGREHFRRL